MSKDIIGVVVVALTAGLLHVVWQYWQYRRRDRKNGGRDEQSI